MSVWVAAMKKCKYICMIIAGVLVVSILVFFFIEGAGLKSEFPIWKVVQEETVDNSVRLDFVGIDYGVSHDGQQDEVLVRIIDEDKTGMVTTPKYHLEFLKDSQWYAIYDPSEKEAVQGYSVVYDPGTDIVKSYRVPAGLFSVKGRYRIYLDYLGYCEFDILI